LTNWDTNAPDPIVPLAKAFDGAEDAEQFRKEAPKAVQEAGIMSTRSKRPATRTGTDCIVVASPSRGRPQQYCGKHTLLGELIGKAALRSCARALRESRIGGSL